MLQLPETIGQAVQDLSQRMGLSQLAEKHGHVMTPTGKTFGGIFGAGLSNEPFKF